MHNTPIAWAINILATNEYLIGSYTPEVIQATPWSEVYRFQTNKGYIFLKIVPSALAIESHIINILHNEFQANVPRIIADNQKLHCFLMQNAGIELQQYFKTNFQADILIQAMEEYSTLQINAYDKLELFLKAGIPDWRLENLPNLYQGLIEHDELLIDDGLKKDELIHLKQLKPKLVSICEQLSRYKIKDTFGHADFHDKNILINTATQKTTLIDLGEVVITHPFFSFLNCLYRAKEHFSLSTKQYQQLQLTCFKPWLAFETQEHLFKILALIQQCWPIHSVLGEFRLINSVDPASFEMLRKQKRLAGNLRHWLNQY